MVEVRVVESPSVTLGSGKGMSTVRVICETVMKKMISKNTMSIIGVMLNETELGGFDLLSFIAFPFTSSGPGAS